MRNIINNYNRSGRRFVPNSKKSLAFVPTSENVSHCGERYIESHFTSREIITCEPGRLEYQSLSLITGAAVTKARGEQHTRSRAIAR